MFNLATLIIMCTALRGETRLFFNRYCRPSADKDASLRLCLSELYFIFSPYYRHLLLQVSPVTTGETTNTQTYRFIIQRQRLSRGAISLGFQFPLTAKQMNPVLRY